MRIYLHCECECIEYLRGGVQDLTSLRPNYIAKVAAIGEAADSVQHNHQTSIIGST